MSTQRDIHSNVTALALFFIIGNSVLYLETVPILHVFFSIMRIIGALYSLMLVLRNFKIGGFSWLVCAFYAVLGAVTVLHHGAINSWVSFTINSLSISILIYYALLRSPAQTISILSSIFSILIYFNFATMLIKPNGIFMGSYPLGSNYNQVGATLLCGIITQSVAYNMHIRKFASTLTLCIICVVTPLIFGSMTSSVGCVLASIFFLIPQKKIRSLIIIVFFLFYLLFQTFVVFMQGDLSENKEATYFVEEVLGKEITFTNRTIVWIMATDLISESPKTGYGLRTPDWFDDILHVKSAHNIILQILIYGGFVLLVALLFVIYISVRRSLTHKSAISDSVLFGVCVFFFMMMMENYSIVLIIYTMNLLYITPELSESTENNH